MLCLFRTKLQQEYLFVRVDGLMRFRLYGFNDLKYGYRQYSEYSFFFVSVAQLRNPVAIHACISYGLCKYFISFVAPLHCIEHLENETTLINMVKSQIELIVRRCPTLRL